MSQRTPKWRDRRAMTDRLAQQRTDSDERIDATMMVLPLIIPTGKRVIGVKTSGLPWHELRLDVTLAPGGELIIRAGDPRVIYAMSLQASALMQEAQS
jgi:hypothetical protein